jgi:hypothetical protein
MELKAIIYEIGQLPLSKRFLIVEETLRSIKNEELKQQTETVDDSYAEAGSNKEPNDFSHLVSEKSLASDWLSEDDNRWDSLL